MGLRRLNTFLALNPENISLTAWFFNANIRCKPKSTYCLRKQWCWKGVWGHRTGWEEFDREAYRWSPDSRYKSQIPSSHSRNHILYLTNKQKGLEGLKLSKVNKFKRKAELRGWTLISCCFYLDNTMPFYALYQ